MKKYLVLLSLTFFSLDLQASKLRDIEWKEISNKDGISVFRPKEYKHDSGMIPIKFKAILNHDIVRVLSVLANEDRKTEWMPNAKKIKVLEKKSISDFTVYYRYEVPWPFKDRDFIVKQLGYFNPKEQKVSVDIKSIKFKEDPADGSTVRGITYDGYTVIRPHGENKTTVEMAFLNDFGGYIPKFLINFATKNWPHIFMKQLRQQLNKKDIVIIEEFRKRRLSNI